MVSPGLGLMNGKVKQSESEQRFRAGAFWFGWSKRWRWQGCRCATPGSTKVQIVSVGISTFQRILKLGYLGSLGLRAPFPQFRRRASSGILNRGVQKSHK